MQTAWIKADMDMCLQTWLMYIYIEDTMYLFLFGIVNRLYYAFYNKIIIIPNCTDIERTTLTSYSYMHVYLHIITCAGLLGFY